MKKTIPAMILSSVIALNLHAAENKNFDYHVDRFADIEVLRYEVPGFNDLSLQQKTMIYYLSQAAQAGRDIIWDQHGKYNLQLRHLLENIYTSYNGDRNSKDFKAFEKYLKQVWFGNGIYHHYSTDKFTPEFSQAFFTEQVKTLPADKLPLKGGQTLQQMLDTLVPVIFDPTVLPKGVNQDGTQDVVATSAFNLYDGVTQKEVEDYYNKIKDPDDPTPVSYGLNAKVVKKDGKVAEEVYHLDGLYGPAIAKVIYWLDKAKQVAENDAQKAYITKLIDYYITGDLRLFDEYSILWAEDTHSDVDFVNGFIESYGDPLGMTAQWESYVNFKNQESSKRTKTISDNAQWFEDHSPVNPKFRKPHVKGVSAKAITAAMLGGDAYPATAIGINLPNANWIRAQHGSKSVTIENITEAYDMASHGNGFNEEFVLRADDRAVMDKYGKLADDLHTDLHECLGHGSGQLAPGVKGGELKSYSSTLEETRADLFGLYYLGDPKMVELGLVPSFDVAKAGYAKYILNGMMTQLARIEPGKNVEESHMRNRKLIAEWCYEKGAARGTIEKKMRDGKTYFVVNDYEALRGLFAELLAEIQRIKSEGDYAAGKNLVETYAVNIDPQLHKEVLERYAALNLKPYGGFVNPDIVPVEKDGKVVDYKIVYVDNYLQQQLDYGKKYRTL